ncbi:MAG: undecaprenyl-phosphate galactose phosphotransferase WbaP [Acidithiobacillus sp.]|nr:undecaprenyl-phosphate galactose phosphotransferase WbaP [Acidithiobacillus sp.]
MGDGLKPYLPSGRWSLKPSYLLVLADILALWMAFYLGRIPHALYYHLNPVKVLLSWWGSYAQINLLIFLLLAFLGITFFTVRGHYARRKVFWDELGDILAIFTLLLALNAAIAFGGKWPISRLWLFSTWFLALALLPLMRTLLRALLLRLGVWSMPVVLIGCGRNAVETIMALKSEPILGYAVERILVPEGEAAQAENYPAGKLIQPLGKNPLVTLAALGNPPVVLAMDMEQWNSHEGMLRTLTTHYPKLTVVPPLRGLPLFGMEVMHFFSHDVLMLRVRDNLAQLWPRITKRLFDLLAASLLVVLLSPFLLYIAWRIRRADGGPALYAQERIGHQGKSFGCLKFRSMVIDADARLAEYFTANPQLKAEYEQTYKLKNDPRITSIGKFLRKTSLDELPQLFNVLRGEMSLVGPRPVTAKEIETYYGEIGALYKLVFPGITGLWQVSGRSNTSYSERIYLDSWYVKNWTLWYDIVILLRTIKVVLKRDGAY